jgi:hypothetical protein
MTTMEYQETQETESEEYEDLSPDEAEEVQTEEKPKRRQAATWKRLLDDQLTREVIAGQLGIREETLIAEGADLSAAERAATAALAKMVGTVGTALREG